jgi:hypothetical protein
VSVVAAAGEGLSSCAAAFDGAGAALEICCFGAGCEVETAGYKASFVGGRSVAERADCAVADVWPVLPVFELFFAGALSTGTVLAAVTNAGAVPSVLAAD